MATTFGTRPEDTVADSRGNVQPGVVIQLYPTKTDATNQTALIASVTTNSQGLYAYSDASSRTGLWARDPSGRVWAINPEEFGSAVDANSAAIATKADAAATTASLATKVSKGDVVINVKDYGAVADWNGSTGTDNLAAFQAAQTACPAGGTMLVPGGRYYFSATFTLTKPIRFTSGGVGGLSGANVGTQLVFAAGQTGVNVNAPVGWKMDGFNVYSLSTGAGSDVGIYAAGTSTGYGDLERCTVENFGSHGIHFKAGVGYGNGNLNNSLISHCRAYGNRGAGIRIEGTDCNAITVVKPDTVANYGWGVETESASMCKIINPHADQQYNSSPGAFRDNGNSNDWDWCYSESSIKFKIDSSSTGGRLSVSTYGRPAIDTTSNASAYQTWTIQDTNARKGLFQLSDLGAGSVIWGLRNGSFGAGWLEILQVSSGTKLMRVDSTLAASYWNTHFRAESNVTFDLGSSANGWRDVYANQQVRPSVTKTANYTLTSADNIVIYNGTSLTATLPDPTTAGLPGRVFVVKNINSSSLTVNSAGTSKTLDGAASQALSQWAKASYTSDGTQWLTV